MRKLLVLLAISLALAGCQPAGPVDTYKTDKYMRTHEPKTGGPDL
jgi:predicted small lipoprotein YifL